MTTGSGDGIFALTGCAGDVLVMNILRLYCTSISAARQLGRSADRQQPETACKLLGHIFTPNHTHTHTHTPIYLIRKAKSPLNHLQELMQHLITVVWPVETFKGTVHNKQNKNYISVVCIHARESTLGFTWSFFLVTHCPSHLWCIGDIRRRDVGLLSDLMFE